MTSFWNDGFLDGQSNKLPSPPQHPETTVFASEYMAGYEAATQL